MQRFFEVLFLYAAQFALFYLFMNLSFGFEYFFNDLGHTILLMSFIFQIWITYIYYEQIYRKIAATFISPILYTLYDGLNQDEWIYNIGHSFFWIFTILMAFLLLMENKAKTKLLGNIAQIAMTFLNIAIFIFIYFYFDLKLTQNELLELGKITQYQYKESLEIYNLWSGLKIFLEDPAHIYIILGGLFLGITISYNRLQNIKLTQKIDILLDTYLDKKIKNKILENSSNGSKKELVILFCDIRNFTQLSENNEASEVVETLNRYYSYWEIITKQHNGVINKFIGDAVLILFNLDDTKDLKDGVQDAISGAKKMIEKFDTINLELKNKNLPTLDGLGIGIHMGEVIIGSIGGDERKDYTVVGDNVNIAARLESLTKSHDTQLIISQNIYEHMEDKNNFLPLDEIKLKGKDHKIKSYKLI